MSAQTHYFVSSVNIPETESLWGLKREQQSFPGGSECDTKTDRIVVRTELIKPDLFEMWGLPVESRWREIRQKRSVSLLWNPNLSLWGDLGHSWSHRFVILANTYLNCETMFKREEYWEAWMNRFWVSKKLLETCLCFSIKKSRCFLNTCFPSMPLLITEQCWTVSFQSEDVAQK